jgi:hypothetical protein
MSTWDWLKLKQKILDKYGGTEEELDNCTYEQIELFKEEFSPKPEPKTVSVRSPAEEQQKLGETQDYQQPSAAQVRRAERKRKIAERSAEELPKEPYDQIVEFFKERLKSVEEENVGQSEESVFDARSKEITEFYKALGKVQTYIKEHHRKELWAKGEYYRSRKWISGDEVITAALEKTKFFEVANYLDTHNLDRESPRVLKLAKDAKYDRVAQSGEKKGKKVQSDYAFILVNDEFYKKATQELKLSRISIQKYLQRFCEIGLLRKIRRTGKKSREWLYADGYYLPWDKNSKPRKVRFLTAEAKDALRNFRLSDQK